MNYVILAVRRRWDNVERLRRRLDAGVYVDMAREPRKAFSGSLLATGGGAHVHLEDDIILAKDFESLIEDAVRQYPDDVINFFNGITKHALGAPRREPARKFLWNQCVYFPDWFPKQFVSWLLSVDFGGAWDGTDTSVADFLRHIERPYIRWYPSLVQHQVGTSMIYAKRSPRRQSSHFIDDLEERT